MCAEGRGKSLKKHFIAFKRGKGRKSVLGISTSIGTRAAKTFGSGRGALWSFFFPHGPHTSRTEREVLLWNLVLKRGDTSAKGRKGKDNGMTQPLTTIIILVARKTAKPVRIRQKQRIKRSSK